MASRLDPTPSDSPKSLPEVLAGASAGKATVPNFTKKEVAKRKAKEPPTQRFTKDQDTVITTDQYFQLMEDRPIKFGPKAVGYEKSGGKKDPKTACLHCLHWYSSPGSGHTTCEIFRPSDEQDQVLADDTCMFWSQDGKTFPKLTTENEGTQEEKTSA